MCDLIWIQYEEKYRIQLKAKTFSQAIKIMESFQFSTSQRSEIWKKMFPVFWSLTALCFYRGSKDILKSLNFKYVKKSQIFKSKRAQKVLYARILYDVALVG